MENFENSTFLDKNAVNNGKINHNSNGNGKTAADEFAQLHNSLVTEPPLEEQLEGFISTKGYLIETKAELFLSIDDKILATYGSVIFIGGKSKSGKTSFLAEIMRITLAGGGQCVGMTVHTTEPRNVVFIDTELPKDLHNKLIYRISTNAANPNPKETDEYFYPYWLRECVETEKIINHLSYICNDLKPGLIVIDGLADLIGDTNSQEESKALIRRIMRLGSQSNAAIICVLHDNEKVTSGEGLRGALGSEAQRKCDLVIRCGKTEAMDVNEICFPVFRRCSTPPTLEYTFDSVGNIKGLGIPTAPTRKGAKYNYSGLIELIFDEAKVGTLAKSELAKRLINQTEISKVTAYKEIGKLIENGFLVESKVGLTLVK